MLRGAIFGSFALFLGFEALKGGMASLGLPALVLPAVSVFALGSASARLFARAFDGWHGRDVAKARPARVPIDEHPEGERRPGGKPFGRRMA